MLSEKETTACGTRNSWKLVSPLTIVIIPADVINVC